MRPQDQVGPCTEVYATKQVSFVYLTPAANYEYVERWQSRQKGKAEMAFDELSTAIAA